LRSTSLGSEDVDPHEEKATKHGLAYVALDGKKKNMFFSNFFLS
jgi:succinyl-CoA synthetase beta subunit